MESKPETSAKRTLQATSDNIDPMSITNSNIMDMILSWEYDANLAAIQLEFMYSGFDPVRVMREMIAKERNKTKLKDDIMLLLSIALTRGTQIDKIKQRSGKTARDKMTALEKKYNLAVRTKEMRQDQYVTLARLVSTLPHICYYICKTGMARDPVGNDPTIECPAELRFTSAPALFRTEEMYQLWFAWAVKFDAITNPLGHKVEDVEKYGRLAFNNQAFKNAVPELSDV